jgi:hypothetical protein
LDDGHDVQGPVDAPVPGPREPVPVLIPGGSVDRGGKILVYDRPIGRAGLRWCDLQAWWKETRQVEDDDQAKQELYQRLGNSLYQRAGGTWVTISPPQLLLFRLYHDIYRTSLPDLPALLPEVWRHWDPVNAKMRGKDALVQFRMDFLMFAPAGARIVLEVDGQARRALTDAEVEVEVVRGEVAERETAADEYERAGRADRAEQLRSEARALAAHLAPDPHRG